MKVYYDSDTDLDLVKSKKICIVGYGSQGHAHALNLRDSGVENVIIALRSGSKSIDKAKSDGFKVMEVSDAAKVSDICMVLVPDELQADLYNEHLEKNLKKDSSLLFAHGLAIHFQLIRPREDLDVFMIAPKGPGHTVRGQYVNGGVFLAFLQYTKIHPEKLWIMDYLMRQQLEEEDLVLLKQLLRKNVKLIYLENKVCFVVD